jgi:hypothetical protein
MTLLRKSVITGILTIILCVAGFIFLLRGCLAKYDERFIKPPALVFEKNGQTLIFSIVEFQKTTSYSQKGNSIRKSVNTQYYIQTNDGITADIISNKKIKSHKQVKNFPVEMLGASQHTAWLFMGEPMAFDPFTLEKIADISLLEEKNPTLKGKFPAERQFYNFNTGDNNIYFTATDGTKWQLNTTSLTISSSTYKKGQSMVKTKIAALENQLEKIQAEQDSLYQQKNYQPASDYRARKITASQYQQISKIYYAEREQLSKKRDSVSAMIRLLEKNKQKTEETERDIENLQRLSPSFSQLKINQDTLAGVWYGLYSKEEIEKLHERMSNNPVYDETARRTLYTSQYGFSRNEDPIINKSSLKNVAANDYLAAGFLANKKTAQPIHVAGNDFFLLVHKDKIGRQGNILLSGLNKKGQRSWTYNTKLAEWTDWIFTDKMLYVFGVNNKNLSSNESNILHCINLEKGTATTFDYFRNKKTE